jgi:hypothetical protein
MVLLEPNQPRDRFGLVAGQFLSMGSRKKKPRLTPETREKLIAAYDVEFQAAGLGTFRDLERVMKNVSAPNSFNASLLAGIESVLNEMSEPSPQKLQKILSELKGKLRYEIRPMMTKALKGMKDKLPRKPSGGRSPALTPEQKSKACDAVASLIRKGTPYRAALARAGLMFAVSPRTIQRAWQKRGHEEGQEGLKP